MQTQVIKFAVVSASGCCLNLSELRENMERAALLTPGARVERWTYTLDRDGNHGRPQREAITQEG
jgi:hypothetical protein